jgi:hypothetical protein
MPLGKNCNRVYSDKLLDGSGRGSQVVQTAGDKHDSVAHVFRS